MLCAISCQSLTATDKPEEPIVSVFGKGGTGDPIGKLYPQSKKIELEKGKTNEDVVWAVFNHAQTLSNQQAANDNFRLALLNTLSVCNKEAKSAAPKAAKEVPTKKSDKEKK